MTDLPTKTEKKLGLVIDLDTCVGCHACVVNCKEWNTGGYGSALSDQDPYGANPTGAWLNRIHTFEIAPHTALHIGGEDESASKGAGKGAGEVIGSQGDARIVHFPKSCLHCEDAPCVTVCPTGASYKRQEDGIVLVDEDMCIGCGLCAWACAYGAREMDMAQGVMKKCTLCIDRIHNEELEEEDRQPACVRTCPAGARHFGDLGDENSEVSKLVAERGGFDLAPEQGTRPVNKYLPPRERAPLGGRKEGAQAGETQGAPKSEPKNESEFKGVLAWIDKSLGLLEFGREKKGD